MTGEHVCCGCHEAEAFAAGAAHRQADLDELLDLIIFEVRAISRAYLDPDDDALDEDAAAWWREQIALHPFLSRARAVLRKHKPREGWLEDKGGEA